MMRKYNVEKIVEEFPGIWELWEVHNTSMIIAIVENEIDANAELNLYNTIERNVQDGQLIGVQIIDTWIYNSIKNYKNNKLLYSKENGIHEDISPESGIQEENYEQFDFEKIVEIYESSDVNYNQINTVEAYLLLWGASSYHDGDEYVGIYTDLPSLKVSVKSLA